MRKFFIYILLCVSMICNAKNLEDLKDTIVLKSNNILIIDDIIHVEKDKYIFYSRGGKDDFVYFEYIKSYTKHTIKQSLFGVGKIRKEDLVFEDIKKTNN